MSKVNEECKNNRKIRKRRTLSTYPRNPVTRTLTALLIHNRHRQTYELSRNVSSIMPGSLKISLERWNTRHSSMITASYRLLSGKAGDS